MADLRPYKNVAEQKFVELAGGSGWEFTKRGWPDFFCSKDGKPICVEVKKVFYHPLKREQFRVFRFLTIAGVDCFRWSPDAGFKKFSLKMSRKEFIGVLTPDAAGGASQEASEGKLPKTEADKTVLTCD